MRAVLQRPRSQDDGFGLVELIVAMTLMAIVLMALAPFLVNAFKATALNVRISGATELVNQRIDLAQSRAHTSSCEAFDTFVGSHVGSVDEVWVEKRNITYELRYAVTDVDGYAFDATDCKTAVDAPGGAETYYVHAVVNDKKDGTQLAQAKTWIAVPGFGS